MTAESRTRTKALATPAALTIGPTAHGTRVDGGPRESALRRILIVDDEPLIRWSLCEALADQGFAVEQAGSRAAALTAVGEASAPFDVVLLDFRLPDSDDLALLARLRQSMPGAAVILMTAFGAPDVVQGALDLGAFRVIGKPFEVGNVAALVRQACRR